MSQSADDVLKYSQFSIDKTEPFRLRPDLQDVAEYPLPPVYQFTLERQTLLRYEALRRSEEEHKQTMSAIAEAAKVQEEVDSRDRAASNVKGGGLKEELSIKEGLIDELAVESKESKETCAFYLEMADWDCTRALNMMREMTN